MILNYKHMLVTMSLDDESSLAEHFLSLIDKKTIWELDMICSILNINVEDFTGFINKFPMAYGLSVQGKKFYITPELVNDAIEEIKQSFVDWYQRIAPDGFSQVVQASIQKRSEEVLSDTPERISSKIKISVYGNNHVVEHVLNEFLSRVGLQPSFDYTGGYEPIDFQKNIGNDIYNCQFMMINYNREMLSLANLLFEMPEAFLFIFNPLDQLQIDRLVKMVKILISKRKKDLFITFLASVKPDISQESLSDVAKTLSYLVEYLEEKPHFKVSFTILSSTNQIERKITDLIQSARMLF